MNEQPTGNNQKGALEPDSASPADTVANEQQPAANGKRGGSRNRNSLWRRFGVSEAVALAGIPALAYAMTFISEMAFCDQLAIPVEFIQLSTSRVVFVTVSLLLGLWPVLLVLNEFVRLLSKFDLNTHLQYQVARMMLVSLVMGAIILLSSPTVVGYVVIFGTAAVIAFFEFVFPLITQRDKSTYSKKLEARDKADLRLPSPIDGLAVFPVGVRLVVLGILLSLMCAYFHGVGLSRKKTDFLIPESRPDMVVLKFYGDNFILAKFNRETKTVSREFAVLPLSADARLSLETVGPLTLEERDGSEP